MLDWANLLQRKRGCDRGKDPTGSTNRSGHRRQTHTCGPKEAKRRFGAAAASRRFLGARLDGRQQQRISAASQGKFLEYAAEAMDDSAFGLHLAESANPREAGLLFYVTSAANNLGEALALFARYSRIANEAVSNTHMGRRVSSPKSASSAFPGTRRSRLPNLALLSQLRRCERSLVGISVQLT